MEELLKTSFITYAFVAVFIGHFVFLSILEIIVKTKNIECRILKAVLRFATSGALVCLWAWIFLYRWLYPISLAYYEYKNDFVEQAIGIVDCVEQDGKDRLNFIIDGTEYTMAYGTRSSVSNVRYRIDEGETVTFTYGVKSKYIFEIQQLRGSP